MEGVQAAMTTRNLEPDKWRKREEWRFFARRQLLKKQDRQTDRQTDRQICRQADRQTDRYAGRQADR